MADYEAKATIEAPVDEVLKIMTSPDYIEAEARIDGALNCKACVRKNDTDCTVIVAEREDPSREPGARRGATEKSTTTSEWDLAARRNRWRCVVAGRERLVKISGITWIESDGATRTRICEKGSFIINLPLIGNLIAKGLANDLRKSLPVKAKLVEKRYKEKK